MELSKSDVQAQVVQDLRLAVREPHVAERERRAVQLRAVARTLELGSLQERRHAAHVLLDHDEVLGLLRHAHERGDEAKR